MSSNKNKAAASGSFNQQTKALPQISGGAFDIEQANAVQTRPGVYIISAVPSSASASHNLVK